MVNCCSPVQLEVENAQCELSVIKMKNPRCFRSHINSVRSLKLQSDTCSFYFGCFVFDVTDRKMLFTKIKSVSKQ